MEPRVFRPAERNKCCLRHAGMGTPKRLAAAGYVGPAQYFLTICTYQRENGFPCADTVELASSQLLRVAEREAFALLAYCFMPDHVHVLAEARSSVADLRRFVWSAKQRSGFLYRQRAGRRLWQNSYFDRTLRENQSPVDVIRYIVDNPLRRGLVLSAVEYPFWGSQVYSREQILEYIAAPAV